MTYSVDISAESYSNQDKYSFSAMAKSLIAACGVLAASIGGGSGFATINPARFLSSTASTKTGSDEISISKLYESYSPTWSNVRIKPSQTNDLQTNIPESLGIIKMLAFIDGDINAETSADNFFNSKRIATKKVLLRKKK